MRRLLPLLALVLSLALVAAACGGEKTTEPKPETVQGEMPTEEATPAEGDAQAGKSVYASAGCGGCHVLKAANSTGTTGPNLDESKPSYEETFKQVKNGGGGMAAFGDRLEEKQIAEVAAFVAESAGGS